MSEALARKYRPGKFDDVVGHDVIVSALEGIVKKGDVQVFLFSGPSGTGKTTLARIVAKAMGCLEGALLEIDAATRTGIDEMRKVQEAIRYRPFGASKMRAVIIDEAHGLSRQSWESLLKVTEEPPEHALWFFCTTQPDKVPKTIKTRSASFTLKLLSERELGEIYDMVCEAEKIDLDGSVGDLIIREAMGSPRQMLANLAICRDVDNKKQAAALLRTALESDATLELCRYLVKGGSWVKAMQIVEELKDESPESVRIQVCNYLAAVLKGAKNDNVAGNTLLILDAFAQPYNASEGMAPLFMSIGRALFPQN